MGPLGIVLGAGSWETSLASVGELEVLGYSTIWVSGAQLDGFDRVADVLRGTRAVGVGTAIIAVDQFDSDAVVRTFTELEATHPGRFVVGLGGAHGPRPLRTLGEYLNRLDDAAPPVPPGARVLSALGPRMLDLARERTAGALPVLATSNYTAQARDRLGADTLLVTQQFVVLSDDPDRARVAARGVIRFLRDVEGGYPRHFQRMGFTDDDVAQLTDRLVDALVVWGDLDSIRERVAEHHAAGADQVALTVAPTDEDSAPLTQWRQLAQALMP